MDKKVAIIGAGLSGLACAIRLAKTGYQVVVYEKNKSAGGKIVELKGKGYRFDTGASILTLPEKVEELFAFVGEPFTDYLKLKKLEINSRFFYPDGTIIDAFSDTNKFAATIEKQSQVGKEKVIRFLKRNRTLYDLTSEIFLFSPFQKIASVPILKAVKLVTNIFFLKLFKTMHTLNKKWFGDKRIVQLFDRYATYNGSDPYRASATLSVISHLEHNIGSYLPEKGMFQLIKALVLLCKKHGVELKFDTTVQEITIDGNRIKGLRIDGKFYNYDIIINNTDVFYTYKKLLNGYTHSGKIFRRELSSSSIIFYWGVNKTFNNLQVHNILFTENYKEEFDYIFRKKMLYDDPTVYIYISSKVNSTDAPEGSENWLVMINTPNDDNHNWNWLVPQARKSILKKIHHILNVDLEKYIEFEKHSSPSGIEKWTNSFKGSLYGPSSNSVFSVFQRHANFKRTMKGLYFAGGTVHPGGGIPLCMASAKIVSELVYEDFPIEN